MPEHTYLFIDGEYLRQRHRDSMQEFFKVDGELDVEPILRDARASRAYFYDSVDTTRREGEADDAWQSRVKEREMFLASVQSLSGFHVRRGTVTLGKKREQKEVDVQLTVDMLTYGFNGAMSKAVLLAGDRDFALSLMRSSGTASLWMSGITAIPSRKNCLGRPTSDTRSDSHRSIRGIPKRSKMHIAYRAINILQVALTVPS